MVSIVSYEILSVVVLIMFLLTVGLIIAKKVEFVKALLASSIIITIIAGVPLSGEGESIANYVIVQGAMTFVQPMIIYFLSIMIAQFFIRYEVKSLIEYLFMYYFANKVSLIVWLVAFLSVLLSAAVMNLGAVMFTAILFTPILLKIGFDKQTAVSLILLTTGLGSCLNPAYYLIYSKILNIDVESIAGYYHVLSLLCAVALAVYIAVNLHYNIKLVKFEKPQKQEINFALLLTVIIPFVVVFIFNIEMQWALLLSLVYGFLVAEENFSWQIIFTIVKESIDKSKNIIILLIAVGIFVNAVKTQAVVHLIAPLFIAFMPQSPVQCLLFFTILSPLVIYKGPFNLQGMGAGLNTIIMSSSAMNPMVLGIALLSLNTLRRMMDPLDAQNIALAQYVEVDICKVIKKIVPYALMINYCMLFYALVSAS